MRLSVLDRCWYVPVSFPVADLLAVRCNDLTSVVLVVVPIGGGVLSMLMTYDLPTAIGQSAQAHSSR